MRSLLTALQHGDSLFPSGGFAFSQGLEASIGEAAALGPFDLAEFVTLQVRLRWAGSDRVALVRAFRAGAPTAVAAIDREVEAATIVETLRTGSRRNGGALLTAHARIGTPGAAAYRDLIRSGDAHGHLPVAQGFLWRALGLGEAEAVAIAGYGHVSALLAAAIRLGAVGAIDAQVMVARLLPIVEDAAAAPIADDQPLRSFVPLAEIAAMRHGESGQRLFAN